MENATKALLIAAAILIAIILISLGIAVVRQGSEAVNSADLSEAEATQFNMKFTQYEGTRVSTDDVNALLATVLSHNVNETANGTARTVTVKLDNKDYLKTSAKTYTKLAGSSYYSVQCTLATSGAKGGLVETINIKKLK